jgi:hypothetical protein
VTDQGLTIYTKPVALDEELLFVKFTASLSLQEGTLLAGQDRIELAATLREAAEQIDLLETDDVS